MEFTNIKTRRNGSNPFIAKAGSESLSAKEKLMSIPDEIFGRIAVAAGAASPLLAAKPNSVFGGVQIGTITSVLKSSQQR